MSSGNLSYYPSDSGLLQEDGEREMVCLNIGGKKFYVLQHNFDRFPNTRLGHLVRETAKKVFFMAVPLMRGGKGRVIKKKITFLSFFRQLSSDCHLGGG